MNKNICIVNQYISLLNKRKFKYYFILIKCHGHTTNLKVAIYSSIRVGGGGVIPFLALIKCQPTSSTAKKPNLSYTSTKGYNAEDRG